ncbi:MAG: hypothetical protein IVW56_13400 [Candidatus Binataceae bacterium]|nr:hypothetical protein [Candidatus Binataceae bacterium]
MAGADSLEPSREAYDNPTEAITKFRRTRGISIAGKISNSGNILKSGKILTAGMTR